MKCPKCDDVVMDPYTEEGIEVDRCPKCHGIWLDKGEIWQILTQDLGLRFDEGDESGIGRHTDRLPATCRACGRPMEAIQGRDKVRFDYCRKCKGTFLDAGELATLQVARRFR